MSGFRYRVSFPQLQADKFTADVKTACREALIMAARKFLLVAVPRVPTFTGFSRGAFGNLEDATGRVQGGRINTKVGGYVKATNYATRKYYYYSNRGKVLKNTITGRQFATQPAEIFSKGRARVASSDSVIFFRFTIDIKYFNYLDPAKWGAFKAGQAAFNQELKTQLQTLLPKIGKYIIRKDNK